MSRLWTGRDRGHGFQCDHRVAGAGKSAGCTAGEWHRTIKL